MMTADEDPSFVSTGWLADHLGTPDLAIIDTSWYLPAMGRDALAEYRQGHIPGAVFFDLDAVSDQASELPHMLPPPEAFAAALGRLGVSDRDQIVVYDGLGLFSAPRVWWSLRTMGARNARLLAGGLPQWKAEGRPLESGDTSRPPADFKAGFDPRAVRSFDQVRAALMDGSAQILDVRPAERFAGALPEPRPGVAAGHMPGARNIPFPAFLDDGHLKGAAAIRALAQQAGLDLERPIVTSCGSGVTAAIAVLALEAAGAGNVALYDGSWAEWGSRPEARGMIVRESGADQ